MKQYSNINTVKSEGGFTMHIKVLQGDITKLKVDAIVNAANSSLLGGSGVDGAIHRAAGKELLEECRNLHGCKTGEAKITKGYNLPAKYIIHTVGPVWNGGTNDEEQSLQKCYENALCLAIEHNCKSVAFPAISTGVYGFPKEAAAKIAVTTIRQFTKGKVDEDFEVWLVAFDPETEKMYHSEMGKVILK